MKAVNILKGLDCSLILMEYGHTGLNSCSVEIFLVI